MEKQYKSLKMDFSVNESFVDDRLIEVNLLVMHDQENKNYSSFTKEAMEDARETLQNIPILAYIKQDDVGNVDFNGHDMEIVLSENNDGEMEYRVNYLEKPIGVIPQENDYHYEERDGRIYVACKGYLWREYLGKGIDILRENSTKGISMEIIVDSAQYNQDTDIYEIDKYRYIGVTVLGDSVEPAMHQTTMEVVNQFSIKDNTEFFEKVKQLNEELKQSLLKGGDNLDKEKNFEEEVAEVVEETVIEEITEEETIETAEQSDEAVVETEETTFDTLEEEAVEDETVETEEISEEDFELKYNELLKKHNELEVNYKILESEVFELKEFKATKEKEEFEVKQEELRQEKISHINTEYESISDDIKELFISKVDEYETTDDIDADMCVYIVKNKVTFSKVKKEPTTVKVSVEENTQNPVASPYGDLF